MVKARRPELALAVVNDLRVARAPATAEDLEALETDVLAGFVLARAAAGLSDGTISSDVVHLEQVRAWFGRPLWEMEPTAADVYFGRVLRSTAKGTRLARAQALKTFYLFLELRHKIEIHQMTGCGVECPIDEMNRPRGRQQAKLRIPPTGLASAPYILTPLDRHVVLVMGAVADQDYLLSGTPSSRPKRTATSSGAPAGSCSTIPRTRRSQGSTSPNLEDEISTAKGILHLWNKCTAPVRPGVPLLPSERKNTRDQPQHSPPVPSQPPQPSLGRSADRSPASPTAAGRRRGQPSLPPRRLPTWCRSGGFVAGAAHHVRARVSRRRGLVRPPRACVWRG
jgi:hypothetical protein